LTLPAEWVAAHKEAIPGSGWVPSDRSTCALYRHSERGDSLKVSAAAEAELKALHRKGSDAGWPPVAFLEIAAWHDRNRPFEFVPNQQRRTPAMKRVGGAL
jgi:hypothetical protein